MLKAELIQTCEQAAEQAAEMLAYLQSPKFRDNPGSNGLAGYVNVNDLIPRLRDLIATLENGAE